MGIIGWIIVGAIAGAIAKQIFPGPAPGGLLACIGIGVVGGVLGGGIASAITGVQLSSVWLFAVAIIGSVALLALYRAATTKLVDQTESDTENPHKLSER